MNAAPRDWLMRGLLIAAALGTAAWVASCTEWVDVDVRTPPRGEAARNDLYATQQLLRRLGASVATPSELAQLPPPRATLMLSSWHWDLFPERAQRLKAWVEGGGHLVLYASNLDHEQLKGWLPIKRQAPPRLRPPETTDDASDDEDDDEEAENPPPFPTVRRDGPACQDAIEPDGVPAAYADGGRSFKVCGLGYASTRWTLHARSTPLWLLQGRHGPLVLRTALGQGQVTVIQPAGLLDNQRVLEGDNGLVAIAALQGRPGAQVWFVTEEARPPLLSWLWREAWVVMVFGGAALALALWRGARRFGPLVAVLPPGRRSMTEQITGTAQFLRHQGPDALLDAQIRALETAARNHLRHYDTLDRSQRAAAISQVTGQDAAALALALDKTLARRRVDLPATLELLETARRLLVQRPHTPAR